MIVPVGNTQGGMVRTVSRHAGAVALFNLRDEGVPQTMGTRNEAELFLLEGERLINRFAVHRFAMRREEERAGMIGRIGTGFQILIEHIVERILDVNILPVAALAPAIDFAAFAVEHIADGQGAQLAHAHTGFQNERADGAIAQFIAAGHIAEQFARLLDGHVFLLAFPFGDGLLAWEFVRGQHAAEIFRNGLRDLPRPAEEGVKHADVVITRGHFAADGQMIIISVQHGRRETGERILADLDAVTLLQLTEDAVEDLGAVRR